MEKEVIGHCPVCNHNLIATKLSCKNCELDLTGDFTLNKFSYLDKDEQEFVALFLASEGNFKDVQGQLNITYQKAKQTLANILVKLQLKTESEGEQALESSNIKPMNITINENDHFVVRLIKEKLNSFGGKATIPLITAGKEAEIWFDKEGTGLACDKIPVPNQLTWEAFIAAYDITAAQGGEAYKGYARAGKLGSDKLPINSLEGYIAYEVHGVSEGGSAFSPGFIIAAVLGWIGILVNERGSTVRLVPSAVCVDSYEEALHNAEAFMSGIENSNMIQEKLSSFRHWYYFKEFGGFAPSKFIGYKDMDIKAYEVAYNTELDGRETEQALQKLFKIAEGSLKDQLYSELEIFMGKYGKQPNKLTSIYIIK